MSLLNAGILVCAFTAFRLNDIWAFKENALSKFWHFKFELSARVSIHASTTVGVSRAMNNPLFYLMTPALSGAVIEVIAVHDNHNLNVLLNFQRTHPKIAFLSCSADEACKALSDPNGSSIGVGCYVPCDGDLSEDKFRRLASKVKVYTFMRHARGWHEKPSIALRMSTPQERVRREKLRCFN